MRPMPHARLMRPRATAPLPPVPHPTRNHEVCPQCKVYNVLFTIRLKLPHSAPRLKCIFCFLLGWGRPWCACHCCVRASAAVSCRIGASKLRYICVTMPWGLFGLKMLHGGWEVSLRCYGNGACITFFTGWRRLGSMHFGDEAGVPVLINIII